MYKLAVKLPGSKSIALRQLTMAGLCQEPSDVIGIPDCDDTQAMMDCLANLGAKFDYRDERVTLEKGIDMAIDRAQLNLRMSGTSTRLLLGVCSLISGTIRLDGHASLRARSNASLLEAIASMGCHVSSTDGLLPVELRGPIKPQSIVCIDTSISSQYLSSLLIALPATGVQSKIELNNALVSKPYVDITISEMTKRGISVSWETESTLSYEGTNYKGGTYNIEGDASGASYFAAMATLHGGSVTFTNLGCNTKQGDYRFLEILEHLGAVVTRNEVTTTVTGSGTLNSLNEVDMEDLPDTALTLMCLAPFLKTRTTITGISSLAHKECHRIQCPARELQKLGVPVKYGKDFITISPMNPTELNSGCSINTYDDHRMAMAFSIIGSMADINIESPEVVSKTYPRYWKEFARLPGRSNNPVRL